MRLEIKLPFLGQEIEYCRVLRWLVKPGERVEIDQDLAEIEAGGEMMAFPSPVDGRLLEILARPGTTVVTDEVLAVVDEEEAPESQVKRPY